MNNKFKNKNVLPLFYHYGRTCSRTIYKRLKFNMLESGFNYPSPSASNVKGNPIGSLL